MPFICLANANVPDGVLQITDLWPNVSQHNNPTYPPGQNRYLRRPGTDAPAVLAGAGLAIGGASVQNLPFFDGLGAYLVDKVEPGSLEQASADITLTVLPQALDRIVISGVADVFIEFSAGANDATTAGTTGDPFIVQIAGTAALTAANVTTVLTDPAAIATMKGLMGATNYVDCADVGAVLTLDALTGAAAPLLGRVGDFALSVPVGAARITLPTVERLARTNELWTEGVINAATAAVLARLDAGTADMNLAGINTALLAGCAGDLTGAAATSASVGTVAEFLSVLAGRTYRLPSGSLKFTAATAPDTAHLWSATLRGSFTTPNVVFDTGMLGGEWGAITAGTKALKVGGGDSNPEFLGGDTVQNELGEARATYDSTAFQASVNSGQLSRYAAGVTLFPDPEVQAWSSRQAGTPIQRQATLVNQRIVTVYDDDGSLLV